MEVAATGQAVRQPSSHGSGGTLFGIQLVNMLLTVVTLGIYSFWGKTRVRRYLWSQAEFEGDRFAYHGTGKELLIGWLKAVLIMGVLYGAVFLIQFLWPRSLVGPIAVFVLVFPVTMVLVPIAIVGSRRYRFSRTSWRGVRFSFRGETKPFVKIYVGGLLLTMITFSFYSPFLDVNMWRFLIGHSQFGSQRFEFDGQGRDLFGRYVRAFFLSFITLGIYWFWYLAERQRYLWAHTTFSGARFRSTLAGGPYFRLTLGNVLLVVFTLGLALPWARLRNIRFVCQNLFLEGPVDFEAIQQQAVIVTATGESLAEFLGLDYIGMVPG